jgi:hypothetical protein
MSRRHSAPAAGPDGACIGRHINEVAGARDRPLTGARTRCPIGRNARWSKASEAKAIRDRDYGRKTDSQLGRAKSEVRWEKAREARLPRSNPGGLAGFYRNPRQRGPGRRHVLPRPGPHVGRGNRGSGRLAIAGEVETTSGGKDSISDTASALAVYASQCGSHRPTQDSLLAARRFSPRDLLVLPARHRPGFGHRARHGEAIG